MILPSENLSGPYADDKVATLYLKKYEAAKNLRENFVPLF